MINPLLQENPTFQEVEILRFKQSKHIQKHFPFLENNQLHKYLKVYSQLKNIGLEPIKKCLANSMQNILDNQRQKCNKNLIHPCQERIRYTQLLKWLQTHLNSLYSPKSYLQLNSFQLIELQKQTIISAFIQLNQLIKLQCQQKQSILSLIVLSLVQIINTLVIQMQNQSSDLIIKHLQDKNKKQTDLLTKIQQFQKKNQQLNLQKNHKWKNMFMVIKDNRILRKQKHKLMKLLKEEQEKVKIVNQEHLKLKEQNQKYILLLSNSNNGDQQEKKITHYVNTKIQVNQIDKYIKLYPKKVQKIVMNQLKKIEIHQLSTIQQKLAFIIKAIQNAGQMIDDFDEMTDFLDSNKVKMLFNISTQTQIQFKETSMNTSQKISSNCQTQVPLSKISQKLKLDKMNICERIKPTQFQIKRIQRKGKTVNMANIQKIGLNKQNRKLGSIKKLLLLDGDLSQGFQYTQEVKICYPNDFQTKTVFKRRNTTSSDSDNSVANIKPQIDYKVRFQRYEPPRNRDTVDSVNKGQDKLKVPLRNVNKRMSRVQNMHTFSSKSKIRQYKLPQQNWKISRLYEISALQNNVTEDQIPFSYHNQKFRQKVDRIPLFNAQNYLTGNIMKKWRFNTQYNQLDESENLIQIENKLATKRNLSSAIDPNDMLRVRDQNKKLQQRQKANNLQKNSRFSNSQISKQKTSIKELEEKQTKTSKQLFKINTGKRQSKQSTNTLQTEEYLQRRLFTQQAGKKGFKKTSPKRLSQMPNQTINLNTLKAKKLNRQASFITGPQISSNNFSLAGKKTTKRTSQMSFHSFGNQRFNLKHNRTKTQGIQQIQQIAEQTFLTSKYLPEKQISKITVQKTQKLQDQFEQSFSPKNKYNLGNISDLQKIDSKCEEEQSHAVNFDLNKNIDKIIKNISQRSAQIIKKEYLFKQFLVSFYQQQYGGNSNMKLCLQFINQIKNRKNFQTPAVNCLNLLMNQSCPEIYRKDIFKLFTLLIDKNGGSLHNCMGGHNFYKKIITQILKIFISQNEVKIIINALCIESLNGSLADYFIAGQMQIRKRSLNNELHSFLSKQILLPSQTLISFELIKQLVYFLSCNNLKLKNKLMQIRVYSQPNIELHRLCLIAKKLNFKELTEIQYMTQKRYQEFMQMSGESFNEKTILDMLAKQRFSNFPSLKQVLHRQIENYYKYNIPLSRVFLKLCHLTLFQQKMINQFPLSDHLKVINQKCQKIDRLRYYKEILQKPSK